MISFAYTARDRNGRRRKGVIDADSTGAAWRCLRRDDLQPIRVTQAEGSNRWRRQSLPTHGERVAITRQLAMLIAAGTPIERALHTVGDSNPRGRACLEAVRAGVVQGESFADALARGGPAFPPFHRAIVRAGEHGGTLGGALERLASHLEASQSIRRRLLTALAYPSVLAVVAFAVVAALMALAVPRLAEHLRDLGQDLPILTRFVVGLSEWIGAYGMAALAVLAALIYGSVRLARSFPEHTARLIWSLPVIGGVLRDVAAARFCRAFAALTHSGIPVTEALRTVRDATEQPIARAALMKIETAVGGGESLGSAIGSSSFFPPVVAQMATGSDESGALAPLFDKSAEYLESSVSARTAVLLAVLEPLITVVMGAVVLVIVLAIMLPILRLNAAILP